MATKKKTGSKKSGVKKSVRKPKTKVKKSTAKKTAGAKAKKAAAKTPEMSLEKIGEITHYFPHVKAAAIKLLKSGLKVGDSVYIKGHTTDFKEKIKSIQLDRAPIQEGKKGQEIGLLVKSRVRQGDSVYKI
jgi:hypothetical protein